MDNNHICVKQFVNGKISIPKEITEVINLKEGDNVIIYIKETDIFMKKIDSNKLKDLINGGENETE